jgi:hypothetical protein
MLIIKHLTRCLTRCNPFLKAVATRNSLSRIHIVGLGSAGVLARRLRRPYPFSVAQTSKSAVSRVSKPAGRNTTVPTWKSAAQQVWKPALRLKARSALNRYRRPAEGIRSAQKVNRKVTRFSVGGPVGVTPTGGDRDGRAPNFNCIVTVRRGNGGKKGGKD